MRWLFANVQAQICKLAKAWQNFLFIAAENLFNAVEY